jgi:hypothetical protein
MIGEVIESMSTIYRWSRSMTIGMRERPEKESFTGILIMVGVHMEGGRLRRVSGLRR